MAGVPHAGERIQIGWLPDYPDMPGWLTVDHVDHFPSTPWDDSGEHPGSATCVIRVPSQPQQPLSG